MDNPIACTYCGAEFIIQEIPPHKHLIAGLPDYEGSWYAECSGCTCTLTASTKEKLFEALRRRPEPKNKPLTLEQLRERKNGPVWVEWRTSDPQYVDGWEIVGRTVPLLPEGEDWRYGETWVAYDRPPAG